MNELLNPGTYPARLLDVVERVSISDFPYRQERRTWVFTFRVDGGDTVRTVKWAVVWSWGQQHKFHQLMTAFRTTAGIDTYDLILQRVRVEVIQRPNLGGRMINEIVKLLPLYDDLQVTDVTRYCECDCV